MIAKTLKDFLDQRKTKYVTIAHSPAYTAHEVAQSAHIPGRILAKTVMVVIDEVPAMAVVPANHRVLVDDLRELTGSQALRLFLDDVEIVRNAVALTVKRLSRHPIERYQWPLGLAVAFLAASLLIKERRRLAATVC